MKKILRNSLILIFLLTAFTGIKASTIGEADKNGAITGRVLDENNLPLPGANVIIESLKKGTITDVKGDYTLVNIPEGKHVLKVTYMGYQEQTLEVDVADGQVSNATFTLKPAEGTLGDVILIGSQSKGQAKALNQQKNNDNITNVVSADQVGRFPDANIGDAMKRIPGITMQNDQGEARNIIIRGMAPQLNSVTVNGERVPSAEGDNRRVQMDLIPADMIQTIEVNKAVTPDMDADAIGGSVNLVTRAPSAGLRVSGTGAGGYNFLSEKPIWTGGLVVGNRLFGNKLGFVVSASYNYHDFGSDNVEFEWANEDEDGNTVNPYISEMDIREYKVRRIRQSVSANLDYKFNERHKIYFTSLLNRRDDNENRFRLRITDIEQATDGTYTGAEARAETKGGIDNDDNENRRLERQETTNLTVGGEHLFGSKIKANWSVTYGLASESRPDERYIRYDAGTDVNLNLSDTREPIATPTTPLSLNDFEFKRIEEQQGYTEEEDLNGRLDVLIPFNDAGKYKNSLKVGTRIRTKEKLRANSFNEIKPADGDFDGQVHPILGGVWDDANGEWVGQDFSQIPASNLSDPDYLAGSQYQAGVFADPGFLGGLNLGDRSLWDIEDVKEEYQTENYNASEDILAGYAMWKQEIGARWTLIGGVRVENTQIEYAGNQFVIDANGDPDPSLTRAVFGKRDYTNVLPGLHAKYLLDENTVLRAAWTNTLARPDYFNLVPYRIVNNEDNELEKGNPDLDPTTAMNFDLMAEKYFKSIGIVSAGVFYKDISDFIFVYSQDDVVDAATGRTFDQISQPLNGDNAQVYGVEVSFQRKLDFLPGIWKNIGVYTNYTHTESETSGIPNRPGEKLSLPGTAENMFNASLSYEDKKLLIRVSINFASDYIDEEYGDNTFEDRYYDTQTFIDINGTYTITKQLRFFFEVNNLTNQPLRFYQGTQDQTMQAEYYSTRMNLGVKFDL